MTCGVCTAPTGDHANLCQGCTARLVQVIAELPALLADLEQIIRKQTRLGGQARSATESEPPINVGAFDIADELHSSLVGWTRVLVEDRHLPWPSRGDSASLARWLLAAMPHIRMHEAADVILKELGDLARKCRRLIEPDPPKRYAGPCPVADCGHDLWAETTSRTVICPACRTGHDVAGLRAQLIHAAEDRLATVAEIARAIVAWTDDERDATRLADRIRKWRDKGQLATRGHMFEDGKLRTTHRLGDALNILRRTSRRIGA